MATPPTASRRSSPALFIAIGMALAALVILNVATMRLDPKYLEQQAKLAAEKQAEAAAKAGGTNADAPPPATGSGHELVGLGPDAIIGPSTNTKHELLIGWEWTPDVQADPSKIYRAVEEIRKAIPQLRIRVVNADETPNVTRGVSLDGNLIAPMLPDGGVDGAPVMQHLQRVRNEMFQGAEGGASSTPPPPPTAEAPR